MNTFLNLGFKKIVLLLLFFILSACIKPADNVDNTVNINEVSFINNPFVNNKITYWNAELSAIDQCTALAKTTEVWEVNQIKTTKTICALKSIDTYKAKFGYWEIQAEIKNNAWVNIVYTACGDGYELKGKKCDKKKIVTSKEETKCENKVIDCGTANSVNDCFINAAKNCCPAKIVTKTDLAQEFYREILSFESEKCLLYTIIHGPSSELYEELENVKNVEFGSTGDHMIVLTTNGICKYSINDLLKILEDERKKISIRIEDFKKYICREPDNLILLKPDESINLNFIAGLSSKIEMNVFYTGHRTPKAFSYSLITKPDGMNIDEYGLIEWTPPTSAEGKFYDVNVKVTDGILSSEISFNVGVPITTPLQSEIKNNSLIITEPNSNLKGLTISFLEESNDVDLSKIVLYKLPDNAAPVTPDYVSRVSDFFVIKEPISADLKIKFPYYKVPEGKSFYNLSLYSYIKAEDCEDVDSDFWGTTGLDKNIIEPSQVMEVTLGGLEGGFFIGIADDY